MEGKTFIVLTLSGLCFLPAFSSRNYVLVREAKGWAEAKSYCRMKYHDLASVHTQEELDKIVASGPRIFHVWIGLYYDINSWRWSLEKESYYGEEEAEFRMWRQNEPSDRQGHENCAEMWADGSWNDIPCETTHLFVCYSEKAGSSSFIFVKESKTWKEAQSYCRKYHTDLASVRNQAENEQIKKMTENHIVWIGLYRGSWRWSDESPFTNWNTNDYEPNGNTNDCGILHDGQWEDETCERTRFFVCQFGTPQQMVRVKVTKKDSFVNMEDAAEDILQQFKKTLMDHGVSEQMKLTWRKEPAGKIFYLEEKEKRKEIKETSCNLM